MLVIINNQLRGISTKGMQFFGQLMDSIMKLVQKKGETILTVKLNGADVTGQNRSQLDELPISEVQQLEIQSGDPKILAKNTLYGCADFLEKLLKELQSTAELLRLGNAERSQRAFLRCIDNFQVFTQTLGSCRRLLGLNFELLTVTLEDESETITVAENRRRLFKILDGLIEAQVDQDWILLADQIENELTPALENWRIIIPAILEKTKPESGGLKSTND